MRPLHTPFVRLTCLVCVLAYGIIGGPLHASADEANGIEPAAVSFVLHNHAVSIYIDGQQVARYVTQDAEIKRPYFCDVKTRNGIQVTRNHPPLPGADRDDHATMHPGIWLAFGDINGVDFWRNRGTIRHHQWLAAPQGGEGQGGFTESKVYLDPDGQTICTEVFRCDVTPQADGWSLSLDSRFESDGTIRFGDQEEMGLGMRVATPMSEQAGGTLLDARGRSTAQVVWGQSAEWCAARGVVAGHPVELKLVADPDNFRPSWMHARGYGLVVANPFGRKAMRQGETSVVEVDPGEYLQLRYKIIIH